MAIITLLDNADLLEKGEDLKIPAYLNPIFIEQKSYFPPFKYAYEVGNI